MTSASTVAIKAATDAELQEVLELIHKEQQRRASPIGEGEATTLLEPRKQYFDGMLSEQSRIVRVPTRIGKGAFVEPLPLTEEAGYLEGMDRYLSPEWDIPTCPIIGKGPSDHCKHGMGNLDYCQDCEGMDFSEETI